MRAAIDEVAKEDQVAVVGVERVAVGVGPVAELVEKALQRGQLAVDVADEIELHA